jgi:hypothetical protein
MERGKIVKINGKLYIAPDNPRFESDVLKFRLDKGRRLCLVKTGIVFSLRPLENFHDRVVFERHKDNPASVFLWGDEKEYDQYAQGKDR